LDGIENNLNPFNIFLILKYSKRISQNDWVERNRKIILKNLRGIKEK